MAFPVSPGAANAKAQPAKCGGASWYAMSSKTASGERMNPSKLTAAHRSFEFGTKLKVTNQGNGKSVVVRVNDRGPFKKSRVIDVSKAAAGQLGMIQSGVGRICFEVVS
ncbi:septal ring lytic transglycosylase RlpA family protein [Rhizobium laguerreae]|nr:septal ring lytic transglycosylase RlpA family protein [Rhizobium laguerreae]MBY3151052.1 septal ring lytic transglycosylase RlpA family protein [Rhizobium laguerreae]